MNFLNNFFGNKPPVVDWEIDQIPYYKSELEIPSFYFVEYMIYSDDW